MIIEVAESQLEELGHSFREEDELMPYLFLPQVVMGPAEVFSPFSWGSVVTPLEDFWSDVIGTLRSIIVTITPRPLEHQWIGGIYSNDE